MKISKLIVLATAVFLLGACTKSLKPIPDKLVVFTFDDASESHYSYVAPLLKKNGFNATFFVCEFQDFELKDKYMTWEQIKELGDMGFEIGNHTRSHPNITKITNEEFVAELEYTEDKCQSLGLKRPRSFAYPAYFRNQENIDILESKGYHFSRIGGQEVYDPEVDYPLLVPSFSGSRKDVASVYKAFDSAKDGKITVMTFHGVPDKAHSWVTLEPQLFEEYVNYLKDNDFKVISMGELSDYVDVQKALKTIEPERINK
jgi:peptidoglycan/xylan/chitin deacetylase (PgdA/CDA1 family)